MRERRAIQGAFLPSFESISGRNLDEMAEAILKDPDNFVGGKSGQKARLMKGLPFIPSCRERVKTWPGKWNIYIPSVGNALFPSMVCPNRIDGTRYEGDFVDDHIFGGTYYIRDGSV